MSKIIATMMLLLLIFTGTAIAQPVGENTTWTIPITLANPGSPSCADTFGIGVGYTHCIDNCSALPYAEVEQPPVPPAENADARFYDFSGSDTDPECHGMGVKTEIHDGSYLHACTDTFQYQIQVANKNSPWYITWDTARIHQKLSSLVMQDAVTGTLVNVDMLATDSIRFTKASAAKNIAQFYIYATWKPIEPVSCQDCYSPVALLSANCLNFGGVGIGHHKNKILTIWNTGTSVLDISAITSTPYCFTVSGDTRAIAVHDSANYTVSFSPDKDGIFSGAVVITSNSPTSPDTITLSGGQALGVPASAELPKAFALHQNYPNPFNPSTFITYDLPSREYATLKVYNLLGQEVATLVEGLQEAGYKSVEFETTSLSSGVYLYRLTAHQESGGQAETFTEIRKMLLIK